MRIVIEHRTPTPNHPADRPDFAPWVEEGSYASIQLAKQAFHVLRSEFKEGQDLRIRLEDHDGVIPDGWRRGSKILDWHEMRGGREIKKLKRISKLLTKRPEFEEKINLKVRIGPSRPQVNKEKRK